MIKFLECIGMGGGLLIVFLLLILASGIAIIQFPEALSQFAYLVPIVFLFIAIGAFLLLLEHYAYTLHEQRPEIPVGALGLPEGSVRAFLTIGLLTLVAVFGTFLYFESGKLSYSVVRANVPVTTPQQLEELRKELGDRFVVIPRYGEKAVVAADVVSATPDTSRADIAKQLLTMITTVLTTVIGFYFGTRTTEAATAAGAGHVPATTQADTESSTSPAGSTADPAKQGASGAAESTGKTTPAPGGQSS
jgi:hypothetical protein